MANTLTGVNLPTYQISSAAGGNGGSGQFLSSAGINGVSWTNTTTAVNSVLTINQNSPNTLEVKGNIVMNGVDLDERLKTIEKVLMIPERDAILESKYPKLKKMYDEYINELSKARMWEELKK
jgi:hypothetical protein